jgi:hypothetical protein
MSALVTLDGNTLCLESFDSGIVKAKFFEYPDVDLDNTTVDATEQVVNAFALNSASAVLVEFDKDTAFFNQEHTTGKSSKVNQSLYIFTEGLDSVKRKALKSYKDCRCMGAIIEDYNGRYWVAGLQETKTNWTWKQKTNGGGTTNTETSEGDTASGFTRTFQWNNMKDDALELLPTAEGATTAKEIFDGL